MDQVTDGLVNYELAFQQSALRAVLPAQVQEAYLVDSPAFSAVKEIVQARPFQGHLLREWMAGTESCRAAAVRDAVRSGVVEGRTTAEIVHTVMGSRAQQLIFLGQKPLPPPTKPSNWYQNWYHSPSSGVLPTYPLSDSSSAHRPAPPRLGVQYARDGYAIHTAANEEEVHAALSTVYLYSISASENVILRHLERGMAFGLV
ncbi:hypothetical protein D3C79_372370 [compost metagenome]